MTHGRTPDLPFPSGLRDVTNHVLREARVAEGDDRQAVRDLVARAYAEGYQQGRYDGRWDAYEDQAASVGPLP